MSQYIDARERTKAKIEDAYWDLMMNNERITVKKITEKAGIHKSTLYYYYECILIQVLYMQKKIWFYFQKSVAIYRHDIVNLLLLINPLLNINFRNLERHNSYLL